MKFSKHLIVNMGTSRMIVFAKIYTLLMAISPMLLLFFFPYEMFSKKTTWKTKIILIVDILPVVMICLNFYFFKLEGNYLSIVAILLCQVLLFKSLKGWQHFGRVVSSILLVASYFFYSINLGLLPLW